MQPMTVRGEWWLPDNPNDKQAGTFVLDAEQCALVLDRAFAPLSAPAADVKGFVGYDGLFKVVYEPAIYGRSFDRSPYTLIDCTTYRMQVSGETTGERHGVTAIISGTHLEDTSLRFDKVTATYSHLLDWTGWLGLQMASSDDGAGKLFMLRAGTQRRATYCLPDDVALHLEESRPYDREPRTFSVRQEAQITVELPSPLDWTELVQQYVVPVNDLLSFATLTACAFDQVLVHVPGSPPDDMVPLSFGSVDMRRTDDQRRLLPVDMLFTLGDTVGWPNIFKSWFQLRDDYAQAIRQLLSSQYAPFEWADNTFLAASRAADAFHRRRFKEKPYTDEQISTLVAAIADVADGDLREFAIRVIKGGNYQSQPDQLRKLLEHSGRVGTDVLAAVPTFVKEVKDVRNGLTHPNSQGNPGAVRRYWLEQALRWVIRACLLKELGFDEEQVSQFLERNRDYGPGIAKLRATE